MMPDQSDLYNHVSGKNHLKIYQQCGIVIRN